MGLFGTMPVGALVVGSMAEALGEQLTVTLGAGIVLAFVTWLFLRMPRLRALE